MNTVIYLSLAFSFLTACLLTFCFVKKIPGFRVHDAKIVKTKNNLYILSLTLSFKGDASSYLNPEVYIKTKSTELYKAPYFTGGDALKEAKIRETDSQIKHEGILNYCAGIFTLNVFYPVEPSAGDKYFLHVISTKGKVKVFSIKAKIDMHGVS